MATTPRYLSNWDLADVDLGASGTRAGSTLDTGVLRRKYNFGNRVSELAIAQSPFFRFVSKVAKNPTDDPSFKFTERRPSFHRRYAYAVGHVVTGDSDSFNDASIQNYNDADSGANEVIALDDTMKIYFACDYKSGGNLQNKFGQSTDAIAVGSTGTAPEFFMTKQIVKIPCAAAGSGSTTVADYILIRVTAVAAAGAKTYTGQTGGSTSKTVVLVTGVVIRAPASGGGAYTSYASDKPIVDVYSLSIAGSLEAQRSYVVGTTYEEGSALLGETWNDQPFATGYGQTQIWRTEFGMTNTARATVLKYEPNEWARIWREKLIEHKWDIEQSLLFGAQYTASSINQTQGAVDYILNNGNIFTLDVTSKTQDGFLDDLSNYVDPRYNDSKATVFFCSTAVYNWLHKLSGYFANNVGAVIPGSGNSSPSPAVGTDAGNGLANFATTGKGKQFGVDMTRISTIYGDMNVARHIALDQTNVAMLGINMKHCKYRPLAGNGVSRDTSIYVGVQSLENTGTDKRVDMILTEAGMEWQMPESHAVWKVA